ncbi:MAG TPA: glucose 1-dehydrogenase [Methylomirabilota bacterium]|jgi:NAD(P)-dependent dehydrogenase (short-subunit alcohol dehydrogenase family)|nr:glucose 1-dehydrogenase [Methylomirabilota bacterium]
MGTRLAGKVALVTGGASGIGAATCRRFATEGAAGVVIADVNDAGGQALAGELAAAGGQVVFRHLDVTREAEWVEAIREVITRYGRLDVLVNNAGRGGPGGRPVVEHTTEEGWGLLFDVNAKGVFLGTKHAIPAMRKTGGGSVINVVSIYSLVGSRFGTAYHSSKGAARAFTKAAAVQYAPEGIRVNAVHPGFVETPMTAELHAQPGVRDERIALTPLGRLAVPEDVAWGILYLASDESSFVTGSELVIDGGMTAR